ncbi:MAG: hypothetical protein KatS3mg101_0522 [Patescibacteria group bacterium]|nr:MAG: hypothetical protein KatS3mg101_0522 [Patescibacteria group bacterium]
MFNKNYIIPVCLAYLAGLLVSFGSYLIQPSVLPGGSLVSGLMVGLFWAARGNSRGEKAFLVLATASAGVLGWATHLLFLLK